jgi:hypothetical protein
MFAPTLLFATYTTFGPIAQDDAYLYVARNASIVRVAKRTPDSSLTLTAPTTHRIAAVDLDGGRVYYATAPGVKCSTFPAFPPATVYELHRCALSDTETLHELRAVSTSGGDEQTIASDWNGIREIAHDDEWIYALAPSSGLEPAGGRLFRVSKATQQYETLASGLVVGVTNQHPFVLTSDAIYVVSAARLLRVPKSPPFTVKDVAAVGSDMPITALDDVVYFGSPARALDARTGVITDLQLPVAQTGGATYPTGYLGAAPGLIVSTQEAGWTNSHFHGVVVSTLCTGTAQLLSSLVSQRIDLYFIPPLVDSPVAVDSNAVYTDFGEAVSSASTCAALRHRGAGH